MVLCAHDHEQFPYWMSGSVVKEMIRHTSLPTLVLHEHGPFPLDFSGDGVHPLRALVALDGREDASAALRSAAALVGGLAPEGGTVHALQVIQSRGREHIQSDETPPSAHDLWMTREALLREYAIAEMVSPALQVSASVAVGSDIAETIVSIAEYGAPQDEAEEGKTCDMIVLMKHPCSSMQHWSMGSVLERVLGRTNLPVLILPSEKQSQKYHLQETAAPYDTLQAAYSEA